MTKIITFIVGQQKAGKTTFTRKAGTHVGVTVLNTGELVRQELAKKKNEDMLLDSLYAPSNFDGLVLDYIKDGIAQFLADDNKLLFIDSFPRNQLQLDFFNKFVHECPDNIDIRVINIIASKSIREYRHVLSGDRSWDYFVRREQEEQEWWHKLSHSLTEWDTIDTSLDGIHASHTELMLKIIDPRSGRRFKNHIKGDVGFDIECWCPNSDEQTIPPHSFKKLLSGIQVKVGDNCWGAIRPRSGTHFKRNLIVMEGTIDSGYAGDLYINVYNPTNDYQYVKNGDALAQLVPIPKFLKVDVKIVNQFPKTERGERGFGSTGGMDIGNYMSED